MPKFWITLALTFGLTGVQAEIVDSMVASVGTTAIKHSDVIREIKITAFMNRETPNLSPASQKEAVNRLVDQALIRQELEAGMYVPQDPQTADSLLRQLRDAYGGIEPFQKALADRGLNEQTLKAQLSWQATALKFIQLRFGGGAAGAPAEAVNEAFFAWLDQMRKDQRIQIQEARLQ
jgi:hypothetical protein